MKHFALLGVLVVLVPAGTAAARTQGQNDGALLVKNADGKVLVIGRGLAIGSFEKGQVTIKDPNPFDGRAPIVTGADITQTVNERTTRYSGSNIRFRIIGGSFTVNVVGSSINLSVIGRGMVTLDGRVASKGNPDSVDGTYAFNGDPPQPFPNFVLNQPLAAPQPAGP